MATAPEGNCIFCRIRDGSIPSKRVFEDDRVLAFEDVDPKAPTHLLVIPREHIPSMNELVPGQEALVGHMVLVASQLAKARGHADGGYRVALNCNADAGQTVFHLHLHLLGGRRFDWPPG